MVLAAESLPPPPQGRTASEEPRRYGQSQCRPRTSVAQRGDYNGEGDNGIGEYFGGTKTCGLNVCGGLGVVEGGDSQVVLG